MTGSGKRSPAVMDAAWLDPQDEGVEHRDGVAEAEARRRALNVILGASELVGAHGLHLTWREVEEISGDVRQALRDLGVTDEEIAASDAEAAAEEERLRNTPYEEG